MITLETGTGHEPWTWEKADPLKNGAVGTPQGLKTLPFVSSYMRDNVKVIHFLIKSRSVCKVSVSWK